MNIKQATAERLSFIAGRIGASKYKGRGGARTPHYVQLSSAIGTQSIISDGINTLL